jgi:hypothetical protein
MVESNDKRLSFNLLIRLTLYCLIILDLYIFNVTYPITIISQVCTFVTIWDIEVWFV